MASITSNHGALHHCILVEHAVHLAVLVHLLQATHDITISARVTVKCTPSVSLDCIFPSVGLDVHLDGFICSALGQQDSLCHTPLFSQLSQLGLGQIVNTLPCCSTCFTNLQQMHRRCWRAAGQLRCSCCHCKLGLCVSCKFAAEALGYICI